MMMPHELRIMTKNELDELIKSVIVVKNKYPLEAVILPYRFCPRCGCSKEKWTQNMASYPERWHIGYCFRCEFKIGESDNSPFVHCLEYPEDNYWLDDPGL